MMRNTKKAIFLALIISFSSCFEPPQTKDLNVPFFAQINPFTCGAACVQMWAHYSGNTWAQQQDIDIHIRGSGATPSLIVEAVIFYCHSVWAIASYFAEGNEEQNHATADQLYSIRSGYPCIPIIYGGMHAVILKKAKWHRDNYGTPWTDAVWYHDPNYYAPTPNTYASIGTWKGIYQSCVTGSCYCTVIDIMCSSNPEAIDAYNQYRAQGGTYYGESPNQRREWQRL